MIEGVGLWLAKRWGEYFAVVATSLFLPVEIYELTEKVTALRVGVFVVNIAAVVWLVVSKRCSESVEAGRLTEPSTAPRVSSRWSGLPPIPEIAKVMLTSVPVS